MARTLSVGILGLVLLFSFSGPANALIINSDSVVSGKIIKFDRKSITVQLSSGEKHTLSRGVVEPGTQPHVGDWVYFFSPPISSDAVTTFKK